MSAKSKGISAERELIHRFWQTNTWTACRVAGSGSMKYPSPDILAQSESRQLAIECKACKDDNQYFDAEEIEQLKQFATIAGCEAWVAVRFSREDWRFLPLEKIPTTKTNYVVSRVFAREQGLQFDSLAQTKHL